MSDATVAAIRELEASGVLAAALAAFALDPSYAIEMADAHAQTQRVAASAQKAALARAATRAARALQTA